MLYVEGVLSEAAVVDNHCIGCQHQDVHQHQEDVEAPGRQEPKQVTVEHTA